MNMPVKKRNPKIKIAIVEKRALLKGLLEQYLNQNKLLEVVLAVQKPINLVAHLKTNRLEIAILSCNGSFKEFLPICSACLFLQSDLKILLLADNLRDEEVVTAQHLGVVGVMTKRCTPEQLETAILSLHQSGNYISEEYKNIDSAVLPLHELLCFDKKEPKIHFSKRELEVLIATTLGMSIKQIADKLQMTFSTVKNHRAKMMRKLNVNCMNAVIIYAFKYKLIKLRDLFIKCFIGVWLFLSMAAGISDVFDQDFDYYDDEVPSFFIGISSEK